MNEISRERFEAWLFSQPNERTFDYQDVNGGCVVCSFIKETTCYSDVVGGGASVGLSGFGGELWTDVPAWMRCGTGGVLSADGKGQILSVADLQKKYVELFGDPFAAEDLPRAEPTPASSATTPDTTGAGTLTKHA